MAKQTFTTGQVLSAAQMTSLQQTAMGGGSTTAKTASYTLVAADAGTVVQMNSASATTITVNTALFAAGDTVQIQNVGTGVCTVTAGTATVNTSSTLALKQYDGGQLYFNSTSAAIFFSSDAADAGASPLTTKGDLYTFTTVDARLGVGANDTVLTADSAQATGLKWATPTSGGMTSLASGSLSGASVVLSTISGSYTHLQLSISNFLPATIDASFYLRVNADATANRYAFGATGTGSTFTFNQTGWQTSNAQSNSSSNSTIIIDLFNYTKTSGWKTGLAYAVNNGSGSNTYLESFLIYNQTPAITGLTMLPSSGNFTSGTYTLYGVK
jgi:hypothetical protein